MAVLRVTPKGGKPSRLRLGREVFRIGRSSRNDLQLSSDPALSRFHAEIRWSEEGHSITDLKSRNGTFVNGSRIRGTTLLKNGDRISVGETEILFDAEGRLLVTVEESSIPTDTTNFPLEEILNPPEWTKRTPGPSPVREGKESPETLSIITHAGRELVRHRPIEEVFEVIMDLVFQAIPAERGCLMLREGEEGDLVPKVARQKRPGPTGRIALSQTIARSVIEGKQSVLTMDAQRDRRFQERESILLQGIHSAMCVPLWNNREVTGLIYLDTQDVGTRFSREDIRLLTLLANIAAVKIENERLVQDSMRRKQLEEELRRAAEIQRGFLPAAVPEISGLEILGHNTPCEAVGGDSFDLLKRGEHRLLAAIGDVCGKGFSAALLMSHLQSIFHVWVDARLPLPELFQRLNLALIRAQQINRFVSFLAAEIDSSTGSLIYCNAGHNPPFLMRSGGKVTRLPATGMPLGILPQAEFSEEGLPMEPGDLILMFSDGLTESRNRREEEFGEGRLEDFLRENRKRSVREIHNLLIQSLAEFTGGFPQQDDLTLVYVKRT